MITNDQRKSALISVYQFLPFLAYSTCSHLVVMHLVVHTADPASAPSLVALGGLVPMHQGCKSEVGTEHMSGNFTVLFLMLFRGPYS